MPPRRRYVKNLDLNSLSKKKARSSLGISFHCSAVWHLKDLLKSSVRHRGRASRFSEALVFCKDIFLRGVNRLNRS